MVLGVANTLFRIIPYLSFVLIIRNRFNIFFCLVDTPVSTANKENKPKFHVWKKKLEIIALFVSQTVRYML